jgi:hypothetical protein
MFYVMWDMNDVEEDRESIYIGGAKKW